MKSKIKYRRLAFSEREEISRLLAMGSSLRAIGRILNRHCSTISREIGQPYFGRKHYRAHVAQERAMRKRKLQGRNRKLEKYPKLRHHVLARLNLYWSPEQIVNRLKIDYPEDTSMRISKETIYAYVYVLPKGNLRRELVKALRRRHKHRYRKNRRYNRQNRNIPNLVSIEKRPKAADSRKVPGHREGDLLVGKRKRSALGSLVERKARFTLLAPLKDYDHESVAKSFARELKSIPGKARKTMTLDRGPETSSHQYLSKKTTLKVFFVHSKSPRERATNENINGLVRQFFPRGADFRKISRREIKRVQRLLNQRPRKVLNWKTPEEVFNKVLR